MGNIHHPTISEDIYIRAPEGNLPHARLGVIFWIYGLYNVGVTDKLVLLINSLWRLWGDISSFDFSLKW